MELYLDKHPPRLRDRFKKVVKAVRTEKDKRRERAEDNAFERELNKLCPVRNGHGGKSVQSIGARVIVKRAYRGFNGRYIGRVGYIVEKYPVGSTFDVAVKFIKKNNPDLSKLRELPGSIGDFRNGELELV